MFYCGIDVAKHKHAVSLMDEQGQVKSRFSQSPTPGPGFDQVLETLQSSKILSHIGLEATGHYWLALYDELTRRDIR